MDLSQISTEDLQALRSGDLTKVSTAGLQMLRGQPAAPVQAPQDGDPVPAGGAPAGFHEIDTNGKPYIVHDFGMGDVTKALGDLPGVGVASRIGQGAVRLAGKAASGIAGMFGGGNNAVQGVQNTVNAATELPPSNDPLLQILGKGNELADRYVGKPVESAVASLPPGPQTAIEGGAQAVNDVSQVIPALAAARGARVAQAASEAAPIGTGDVEGALREAGYTNLPREAGTSTAGQRVGASIVGEPPLAQHQTLTNQAVTDELARQEAGVPAGQEVNYQTLAAARAAGPGKVYDAAHAAMPAQLQMDNELAGTIANIGDNTSQLPRSPDVDALKQFMLGQPNMTRDQLFSNIQQARSRATQFYRQADTAKSTDAEAMGDAYSGLANAYEDFVGRNLPADAGVSLQDWQNARTAFAKNYTVEAALQGKSVNASKIAALQKKNPSQLTDGLALIAEQANRFPHSTGFGPNTFAPEGIGPSGTVHGILARHAIGPTVGGAAGYLLGGGGEGAAAGGAAGLLASAGLQNVLRRALGGNPEDAAAIAAGARTNPRLSNFFTRPESPSTPAESGPSFTLGIGANPNHVPPAPMGDYAGVLSQGLEQHPPQGLSVAPMGMPQGEGMTFRGSPEAVGAQPVHGGAPTMRPRVQDDYGNEVNPNAEPPASIPIGDRFASAPGGSNRDVAGVMSQGVPEGVTSRTAPQPDVAHEADEQTGEHVATSANGSTLAQESGPYLVVKRTDTTPEAQGKGEGLARMEVLIQQAEARGLKLGSDVSVSPAQQRVYAALKRKGYSVIQNDSTTNPTTRNLLSADPRKPVFEVSSPLGMALGR